MAQALHASTSHRLRHSRLGHDRLVSLINSMADGVISVDQSCHVVLYNGAALNILDINASMHGQRLDHVLHIVDASSQPVDIVAYVRAQTSSTDSDNLRIKYTDGSFANLYLSISPVERGYGRGRRGGFVLLLRDVTHSKSLEEERDEFISVVSHELRTPIAITEGNVSNAQFIAGHNNAGASIQKALDDAHKQIVFLSEMINDLATLSRAERGKLTMEVDEINAHDLVTELARDYQEDGAKKALKITAKPGAHLEPLYSSKLYVREILQNFITNAVKYTEKGGVTISAKPADGGICFVVQDTGIGLSKSDRERVFDKFFRSEDFRTRQNNGTGLGLYVTLKLVDLLHAKVDVTSKLNHGSTFSVFIPSMPKLEDGEPQAKQS